MLSVSLGTAGESVNSELGRQGGSEARRLFTRSGTHSSKALSRSIVRSGSARFSAELIFAGVKKSQSPEFRRTEVIGDQDG